MLAKPPSTCCFRAPEGASRYAGSPRGSIRQIGGIDTYISTPPDSVTANRSDEKVLLYFPDAFGLYENAFLMMDSFAEKGWIVLGVDYFGGVSVSSFLFPVCVSSPLSSPFSTRDRIGEERRKST